MARYTGPRDKVSRRFGVALFGSTKALEKRPSPPASMACAPAARRSLTTA